MEVNWLNLFLVVLVAWLSGALVMRLGYPHVLGELAAGIIFGPPLLHLVHLDATISLLGRLGILMMILFIGSRINPYDLLKSAGAATLPTLGGFLLPFILGYLTVCIFFHGTANAGLLAGTVMGTTALVTLSRFVSDLNLLETRLGQTLMTIALFSIVVVLIFFSAIQGIVAAGSVNMAAIALVLGKAIAFLVIVALLGIYAFPVLGKLHEKVVRHPGSTDELTFAIMLATIVAFLAQAFGLSFILGAFLAGLFLREDMFEKGTFANMLGAIRDASLGFLAPIFYVSAGFSVSFAAFRHPALVFTIIAVSLLAKFFGGMLSAMLTRRSWRQASVLGIGMNARGSIDIIVAGVGLQLKIITSDLYTSLIVMIFVSNLLCPILLKAGRDWLNRRGELVPPDPKPGAETQPAPASA
jgi:Kef-type K+ transport system membrane component KefB